MNKNILWIAGVFALILVGRTLSPPVLSAQELRQVAKWERYAKEAAELTGIDPFIILGVIATESRGYPDAIGLIGEIGLMQLTTPAVQDLGYNVVPKDPRENIRAGALYLRLQMVRMNQNLFDALRAYNAGAQAAKNDPDIAAGYANKVLRNARELRGALT